MRLLDLKLQLDEATLDIGTLTQYPEADPSLAKQLTKYKRGTSCAALNLRQRGNSKADNSHDKLLILSLFQFKIIGIFAALKN